MQKSEKTRVKLFLIKIISFVATVYIKEIITCLHTIICNIPTGVFVFVGVVIVAIFSRSKKD